MNSNLPKDSAVLIWWKLGRPLPAADPSLSLWPSTETPEWCGEGKPVSERGLVFDPSFHGGGSLAYVKFPVRVLPQDLTPPSQSHQILRGLSSRIDKQPYLKTVHVTQGSGSSLKTNIQWVFIWRSEKMSIFPFYFSWIRSLYEQTLRKISFIHNLQKHHDFLIQEEIGKQRIQVPSCTILTVEELSLKKMC
jgi:hypothetical protein